MQTANVMVALGGDRGNTVPLYGITAAEIAVLQVIHNIDAIFDVEPLPGQDIERSNREERRRLFEKYGRMGTNPQGESTFGCPAVEGLFPGAAARVFHDIAELELAPNAFKAVTRAVAEPSKPPKRVKGPKQDVQADVDDEVDDMPPVGGKLFA